MTDTAGIAHALEKKAAWRREKAERHPEDVRNLNAAEMHESLAAQAGDIDPGLLARLTALQDEGAEIDERADLIMTDIGFHRHYTKIDDLIRDIVDLKE
jgi:hypothetical protein